MSNLTEWRWADPSGQQRLVREEELRAALATGAIPANAPIWTRGWMTWRPANEVAELTGRTEPISGAPGSVPPPPTFIVAAQDEFEGKPKPAPSGPAEPPPPPRYVPLAPPTNPQIPTALGSDTSLDAPVAPKAETVKATPSPKAIVASKPPTKTAPIAISKPPAKPAAPSKPPPLPAAANQKKSSAPPPLPAAARKATPPPMAAVKPNANANAKTAPSPGTTTKPLPVAQQSVFKQTQRPPMGVAPQSELLPASSRQTLHVVPAPPPMMPRLDPLPAQPQVVATLPPEPIAKEPSSKFPTLMMFGEESTHSGAATSSAQPSSEETPPIVVPPPEPSNVTNAVTRPPPWGEGAVAMDTRIPKSPPVPAVDGDRPSEAPRPMELSSSDLTSEAHISVAKAAPLVAAERPHATMLGLGPDALSENRAALERAMRSPPPAPLSQSDVASTTKWPAQSSESSPPPPAPRPSPSGAGLHDLRAIARTRVAGATAFAQRTYADLRERTKDKPPWFLPVIGGVSALVLIILVGAGIKAAFGTSTTPSESSSSSVHPTDTQSTTTSTAPTSTAKAPPARPMTCSTSGAARTVAPKAVVSSGVEVATIGGQIALGFASAPKEATFELLDATSLAAASALHLRSTDNVRRVLALDATRAAVDADHKGDKLQGRRTLRASPAIDLGAMDGGIAWAPHGTDKGVKLWSLANADAPVEALRGEPLPNGAGFAVAFRQAGAIWFGAFGGTPPAPLAGLAHVDGLGPQIGSPAIATSGDRVMVAWADRAAATDPWSVRWTMFRAGEETAQAKAFTLPPGGLGEQAMSPGVTSLGAGRFLLVWTEGPVSSHQVRGVVFGESGPIGDAFTASAEGANAGQAQAAVVEGGHGVVAFLASNGKSFELAATPIQCVEK